MCIRDRTDTYSGNLAGEITIDPVAAGMVSADVELKKLYEDWAGEFKGETFNGGFNGTFSYDAYNFTFNGEFTTTRQ